MTEKRPEYIRCIQHTHEYRKNETWCGEKFSSFDWTFQDLDHAAYSLINKSRQVPCPNCIKAAVNVLQS